MNEQAFLANVIELATTLGWLVHHSRPARTADGWRTAIQGDAGFPDLVLARRGRVIFAELKAETGKLTEAQRGWLSALYGEPWVGNPGLQPDDFHHEVYVWRPSDMDEIAGTLGRR